MATVIVIGSGLAGLASAVRLAKLGHQVTICERDEHLGGVLGRVEADGFTWDAGAASTTLPAALRPTTSSLTNKYFMRKPSIGPTVRSISSS